VIGKIIIFQDLTQIKIMEEAIEKSRRLALSVRWQQLLPTNCAARWHPSEAPFRCSAGIWP
jgi:hypothetical protein